MHELRNYRRRSGAAPIWDPEAQNRELEVVEEASPADVRVLIMIGGAGPLDGARVPAGIHPLHVAGVSSFGLEFAAAPSNPPWALRCPLLPNQSPWTALRGGLDGVWTDGITEKDAQAEVIALAFYGGLTHSEIATQLELPPGTVKGRMRFGLDKLRETTERTDNDT